MSLRQLVAGGLGLAVGTASVALCAEKGLDSKSYFDPEALERGAKAVREINSSPLAKKVRHRQPPPARCAHMPLFCPSTCRFMRPYGPRRPPSSRR